MQKNSHTQGKITAEFLGSVDYFVSKQCYRENTSRKT